MPRKTREQKIIADLRRQLKLREAVTNEAPAPTPVSSPQVKITPVKVTATQPVVAGHPYLQADLLRVGLVVILGIAVEAAVTFLVNSGNLKPLGFS